MLHQDVICISQGRDGNEHVLADIVWQMGLDAPMESIGGVMQHHLLIKQNPKASPAQLVDSHLTEPAFD